MNIDPYSLGLGFMAGTLFIRIVFWIDMKYVQHEMENQSE